jgi:hypothetical protein
MINPNMGRQMRAMIEKQAAERAKREAERVAKLKSEGRNADGSYIRPEYESITKDDGMLQDQYQIGKDYKQAELDTRGLDQFRNEALREAGQDSTFAKMALEKQGLEQQKMRDRGAATMNAQMAGQFDNLAAQGGLGGGSRERMAKSGLRDLMRGNQDIGMAGLQGTNQIRMADEQNRINQLGQLPGMELQKSEFDRSQEGDRLRLQEANIRNALAERAGKRSDDMDAWKTNQQTWASNKQADIMSRANQGGGSGCFITTAVCEASGLPDNCDELETLRWFRDNVMSQDEAMSADVAEYYEIAPKIVEAIAAEQDKQEILTALKQSYICPAVELVKQGEHSLAYEIYKDMVLTLKQKFLN